MKTYQLKDLTTEDLRVTLKDSYDALENYRFQHSSGQLENFKSLANTKKEIARILTILKERELAETNKNLKK
jgi:large subunit ribosomal protein L29